jgi:hypothetical protein
MGLEFRYTLLTSPRKLAGRVQPDVVWNTPGEAMHIRCGDQRLLY